MHHGNYRRRKGKRAGRKTNLYKALLNVRNQIQSALDKLDRINRR